MKRILHFAVSVILFGVLYLNKIYRILLYFIKEYNKTNVDNNDINGFSVRNLKYINDGIDTMDKDGELRLTIIFSIVQQESRKIFERVKCGYWAARGKYCYFWLRRIYSYKVIDGKLKIVSEEAELVKDIFHMYLYDGKGSHTITYDLSNRGIPTKKNVFRVHSTF